MNRTKLTILITLALTIIGAFYVLSNDIRSNKRLFSEQQEEISNITKQLGYHNIRLSGQLDTIMVHHSKLEQIKKYLESMGSTYVRTGTPPQ